MILMFIFKLTKIVINNFNSLNKVNCNLFALFGMCRIL